MVKNLPANAGDVRERGGEDPLEKGMATPPHNSCLENPMDREAWQAAVRGVTQRWTRLKHLVSPCSPPVQISHDKQLQIRRVRKREALNRNSLPHEKGQ